VRRDGASKRRDRQQLIFAYIVAHISVNLMPKDVRQSDVTAAKVKEMSPNGDGDVDAAKGARSRFGYIAATNSPAFAAQTGCTGKFARKDGKG
jgi:hypothetical protein